jgi:Protein of unknown function (DUF2459)
MTSIALRAGNAVPAGGPKWADEVRIDMARLALRRLLVEFENRQTTHPPSLAGPVYAKIDSRAAQCPRREDPTKRGRPSSWGGVILDGKASPPRAGSPGGRRVCRAGRIARSMAGCRALGGPRKEIWIVRHGWHTRIAVRRVDVDPAIWPESRDFGNVAYLEVGWGDRDFYPKALPSIWETLDPVIRARHACVHWNSRGRRVPYAAWRGTREERPSRPSSAITSCSALVMRAAVSVPAAGSGCQDGSDRRRRR